MPAKARNDKPRNDKPRNRTHRRANHMPYLNRKTEKDVKYDALRDVLPAFVNYADFYTKDPKAAAVAHDYVTTVFKYRTFVAVPEYLFDLAKSGKFQTILDVLKSLFELEGHADEYDEQTEPQQTEPQQTEPQQTEPQQTEPPKQ